MPQMSNMLWFNLFIYILIIFYILLNISFYYFLYKIINNKNIFMNIYNYKWMW